MTTDPNLIVILLGSLLLILNLYHIQGKLEDRIHKREQEYQDLIESLRALNLQNGNNWKIQNRQNRALGQTLNELSGTDNRMSKDIKTIKRDIQSIKTSNRIHSPTITLPPQYRTVVDEERTPNIVVLEPEGT
jgi:hypothetical protein